MNMLIETLNLISQTQLTIQQLADKAGVSRRWVFYLKSGRAQNPTLARLQRVHDVLVSEINETDKTAA